MKANTATDKAGTGDNRRLRAWQTLLVAATPAVGYLLAYTKEAGFCEVFQIPNQFISVGWSSLLIGTGSIFLFAVMPLYVVQLVLFVSPGVLRKLGFLGHYMLICAASIGPLLLLTGLFPTLWRDTVIGIAVLAYIALVPLVVPLVTERRVKGYRAKLEATRNRVAGKEDRPVPTLLRHVKMRHLLAVMWVFYVFLAFYFNGLHAANTQVEFLVPTAYQELVVLRIYSDTLVCAEVDTEARVVTRTFHILSTHDTGLTAQRLGPLTLAPVLTMEP